MNPLPRLAFPCLISIVSAIAFAEKMHASPINAQSILVSHITENGRGEIIEFSRTGNVLQSFMVPTGTGGVLNSDIRALQMDQTGNVQIFNGTFTPYLTTMTPQAATGAGTFNSHTIAGWSVIGNTSYGSVAIDSARNAIYVNDMATASPGGATGIVRFDSNTFVATRPQIGEYTKVILGQDGLLYGAYPATHPGNNVLDVFDPNSFTLLRTVTLPTNGLITFTGFAVDAQGYIYAAEGREWGNGIGKFNPDGSSAKYLRLDISMPWLHDLALSADGQLVSLSHFGDVVMTTTNLNSYTTFRNSSIASDHSFVAWATVPELSTFRLSLCAIISIALLHFLFAQFGKTALKRNERVRTLARSSIGIGAYSMRDFLQRPGFSKTSSEMG